MKDVRDRRDDDDRENGTNGEDHKGRSKMELGNKMPLADLSILQSAAWILPSLQMTTLILQNSWPLLPMVSCFNDFSRSVAHGIIKLFRFD